MIEILIKEFLQSKTDVPVLLERAPRRTDGYILLEKIGSGEENQLFFSSFAIQSHGATLYEAAKRNAETKKWLREFEGHAKIAKVKIENDYNFTDPDMGLYRYQLIVDIYHY